MAGKWGKVQKKNTKNPAVGRNTWSFSGEGKRKGKTGGDSGKKRKNAQKGTRCIKFILPYQGRNVGNGNQLKMVGNRALGERKSNSPDEGHESKARKSFAILDQFYSRRRKSEDLILWVAIRGKTNGVKRKKKFNRLVRGEGQESVGVKGGEMG